MFLAVVENKKNQLSTNIKGFSTDFYSCDRIAAQCNFMQTYALKLESHA